MSVRERSTSAHIVCSDIKRLLQAHFPSVDIQVTALDQATYNVHLSKAGHTSTQTIQLNAGDNLEETVSAFALGHLEPWLETIAKENGALCTPVSMRELFQRLGIAPHFEQEVWTLSLRTKGRWQGERIAKAWYKIATERGLACFIAPTEQWRIIGVDLRDPHHPTSEGIRAIKRVLHRQTQLAPTFIWPLIDEPSFEVGYLRSCLHYALGMGEVILNDDGTIQLHSHHEGADITAHEHFGETSQSGSALQRQRDASYLRSEIGALEGLIRDLSGNHDLEREQFRQRLEGVRKELAALERDQP